MTRFLILLLLPIAMCADEPRKPTLTRYAKLWTESPFTVPPVVERTVREQVNPLEDYALGGLTKLKDGYYVILINKKKPDEREIIRPGVESDFTVEEVRWSEGSWKDTVAMIRSGGVLAPVGFDDQVLAVKKTPTQQKQPKPGTPTPPNLNQPNANGQQGQRGQKPRVIRPPAPRHGSNGR